MRLFRSMRESPDHLPKPGPSARLLGVRPGNDQTPDVSAIQPTDMIHPGREGMSVAPDDPMFLPKHRRPSSLGGLGKEPVWYLESDDLGPDLEFLQERLEHGVIAPSKPMTLQEYQEALAKTRSRWKIECR